MNYAPQHPVVPSTPGRVWNGDTARGLDAAHVDRHLTALVCARPNQPALIGQPVGDTTIEYAVTIPPYTQHIALGFRCTGHGTITATTPDDAINGELEIWADPTAPSWYWLATPTTAATDGTVRALEVADAAAPAVAYVTLVLTGNLRLHAIRTEPLPRSPHEPLA